MEEANKLDWCKCERCRGVLIAGMHILGYSEGKVKEMWEQGRLFAWGCREHDPTMKTSERARGGGEG